MKERRLSSVVGFDSVKLSVDFLLTMVTSESVFTSDLLSLKITVLKLLCCSKKEGYCYLYFLGLFVYLNLSMSNFSECLQNEVDLYY